MKKANNKRSEKTSAGSYENLQVQLRINPRHEKQIVTGKMAGDEVVGCLMNKPNEYSGGVVNLADVDLWDDDADNEYEKRRRDAEGQQNFQEWLKKEHKKDE